MFVLLATLCMVGCGSAFTGNAKKPLPVANEPLPVADVVAESMGQPEYRIGPHDLIAVTVFQIDDLNREVRVNNAGQISLPLIGAVKAAGLTVEQIENEIAAQYEARYLQNPQVTVFVKEFSSQRITVTGAVKKTGIFPMNASSLSLLQAVSLSEGLTELADPRNVVVIRRVNGQSLVARFDLEQIRMGEMADPLILGNDVIVVDESKGAVWFKRFVQLTPILSRWVMVN